MRLKQAVDEKKQVFTAEISVHSLLFPLLLVHDSFFSVKQIRLKIRNIKRQLCRSLKESFELTENYFSHLSQSQILLIFLPGSRRIKYYVVYCLN